MCEVVSDPQHPPSVWLIDRRSGWRRQACAALQGAGIDTWEWYSYEELDPRTVDLPRPDLVVWNGTRVGEAEARLIFEILGRRLPLLVISGRLPVGQRRDFFGAGARDVVEMPPDCTRIVELVRMTLENSRPVSNYEAVAKDSV